MVSVTIERKGEQQRARRETMNLHRYLQYLSHTTRTIIITMFHIYTILFSVCIGNIACIMLKSTNGLKGEQDFCAESCAPNIHSWTAETWGSQYNASKTAPNFDEYSSYGAPKSAEGKMILLQAAHDQLMEKIEGHVEEFGGREARGGKGGMGSTEGALITISLLTFAVYLIKLVMMLVHALHDKKATTSSGMIASTAQPAGIQTFVLSQGRKRRSQSQERNSWKLLSLMENIYET